MGDITTNTSNGEGLSGTKYTSYTLTLGAGEAGLVISVSHFASEMDTDLNAAATRFGEQAKSSGYSYYQIYPRTIDGHDGAVVDCSGNPNKGDEYLAVYCLDDKTPCTSLMDNIPSQSVSEFVDSLHIASV